MDWQDRTRRQIGDAAVKKLNESNVEVFGVGGVGGFVVEALVRAGVGHLTLVDKDDVDITNINRQIIATTLTLGKSKAEVAAKRAMEINPEVEVKAVKEFYLPQTADKFDLKNFDCVVDAMDTVTAKIYLATEAERLNVDLVSCMGAGNKTLPFFKVGDIYETSVCPLSRVVRRELRERGVKRLTVVYSDENPHNMDLDSGTKLSPASISYVPAAAGLTVAYAVIEKLLSKE